MKRLLFVVLIALTGCSSALSSGLKTYPILETAEEVRAGTTYQSDEFKGTHGYHAPSMTLWDELGWSAEMGLRKSCTKNKCYLLADFKWLDTDGPYRPFRNAYAEGDKLIMKTVDSSRGYQHVAIVLPDDILEKGEGYIIKLDGKREMLVPLFKHYILGFGQAVKEMEAKKK